MNIAFKIEYSEFDVNGLSLAWRKMKLNYELIRKQEELTFTLHDRVSNVIEKEREG